MVFNITESSRANGTKTGSGQATPPTPEARPCASAARRLAEGQETRPSRCPEQRPVERPSWALMLRSPYKDNRAPTSWLGGAPHAPKSFDWPRDASGRPLPFIAQIDLSALKPEPTTRATPPGLPKDGALLVFAGESCAVRLITAVEVALGGPVAAPADLSRIPASSAPDLCEPLPAWPLDLVPYLSRGDARPDFAPNHFEAPRDWITNWAIAEFEAWLLTQALERALQDHRKVVDGDSERRSFWRRGSDWLSGSTPQEIKDRLTQCAFAEAAYPALLAELDDWRDRALAARPDAPVDPAALEALFAKRIALSQNSACDSRLRGLLRGDAEAVWKALAKDLARPGGALDLCAVPHALRPFVERKITDWRGHRLVGLTPDRAAIGDDRRDPTSLLAFAADPLLGTAFAERDGVSIRLDREEPWRGAVVAPSTPTPDERPRHRAV